MSTSRALGVGSRLTGGPAETLAAAAFADELRAAPYLIPWLGVADLAHVALLARAGVVAPAAAARLLRDLLALEESDARPELDPAVGDVYNNRDVFLADRLGPDAGLIHTGRARREATTLAWQLACRARVVEVGGALAALLEALVGVASEHRASLMPDYTYMQAAQPTTLGHYLLGFAYPLLRDEARLERAYAVVNRSPAGSGSVNGTRFGFDRAWVSDLLECDAPVVHNRDAMWAPDIATEPLTALVTTMTNADRLAEDLQLWSTTEFGYVELDDAHARASVIMPHKKNPYALAWIRGRARFLLGRVTGVVGTFLTPSGQPDNRVTAYAEVPAALDDATRCLDLLADVVSRARFDTARMRGAAHEGYLYSTDVCDLLMQRTELDNRSAHSIVGRAVRDRMAADGGPLTIDDLHAAAAALGIKPPRLDASELAATLDPDALVALRRALGGAAPEPMHEMLDDVRTRSAAAAARWAAHPAHGFRRRFLDRIRALILELEG